MIRKAGIMNECGKSGEALEQIIEDMGTPKEIAEEFNQNLPKEERKAYTKTIVFRWIAIVIFVLLLLIAYVWWAIPKYSEFESSGKFSQPVVEEKVKDYEAGRGFHAVMNMV